MSEYCVGIEKHWRAGGQLVNDTWVISNTFLFGCTARHAVFLVFYVVVEVSCTADKAGERVKVAACAVWLPRHMAGARGEMSGTCVMRHVAYAPAVDWVNFHV